MKRNKLKRNKTTPSKEGPHHVQTAVVVVSDRQEKPSAADSEEKKSSLCKGFEIAPIFSPTTQHRKHEGSSDAESDRPEHKSMPPSQSGDVKSPRTGSHLTGKRGAVVSSWRLSSNLESCLEEIQKSNPAFPVPTVFSTLLKKASEVQQESGPAGHCFHPESSQTQLKEKSRRGLVSERLPKRPKSDLAAEAVVGHCLQSGQDEKKQPRRTKLSCSQQSWSPVGLGNSCPTNLGWMNHNMPDTELIKASDQVQGDSSNEDVLWTDKYVPRHSSEVIGNFASVNKLHSWLKKWKLRADGDQRRQMEERKREDNNLWDCGDFQGEAGLEDRGKEPLGKAMLLTGPSGVGKTAAVYACAQELGFKVFEVNCSSQRSGRQVLSQLKEVTQSHLVDSPGEDPLKPAYFNNYSANSFTAKSVALPGKMQLAKNMASKSKTRAARNLSSSGRKFKAKPASVTLARYFKMKGKADRLDISYRSTTGKPETEGVENSSAGCDQTVPKSKKTATSLIVFEEVDVVFEDEVGFLTAIKAFMATTKRPVVLTAGDPLFKERFDCYLDEIIFKTPSAVNICNYLQLVCLAEGFRLPSEDASSLFRLTRGDVRRCLLQLQLWVNSSRQWTSQGGKVPEEPISSQHWSATKGGSLDSTFPPWQAGCSAHMLGLHPVTQNYLLNFLKLGSWSETDMLKFLSMSWRRGVPLLYSNLELLLSTRAPESDSQLQTEPRCPGADLHILRLNHTIGSEVSQSRFKSSRLSRRRCTASASDARSASDLPKKTQRASSFNETQSKAQSSCDKPEEHAAKTVANSLDGLADFFDLMSNIDAMLPHHISGPHTAEAFVWTGAAIKDGLLDESAEEDGKSWNQDGLQEIRAAAEGLGCRRCWRRVTEAWTEAHKYKQKLNVKQWNRLQERLLLTTCFKRQNLSFTAQPPCAPSVSQRRFRLSRMVLSSKTFSLLGNRRAISVDYLPVLRFICRTLGARQHKGELGSGWKYLSSTHLGLSKSAVQLLAEDFSLMKVQKDL